MASPTILVADEDTDTRLILRALLERNGYQVVDAATGADAVALADRHQLALIILNHPMDVDGQVTLAKWLLSQPRSRATPIINLTSRAIPAFIEEARQLGVAVTMTKPLDVYRLLQLVMELTSPMVAR